MDEKIKVPTKEEVSHFLDLNVENVNKVFLYAKTDQEGNIIADSEETKKKSNLLLKATTLREKGTSENPVYFNFGKLLNVRKPVIGFFQQLQVSFWNKGLAKEDPRYTKSILKDLIGLKACDGKTNVVKLKNKAGKEEYISVWADQAHKDAIDKLLYLARGLDIIAPLMDSGMKDKSGNPVLAVDTTKEIFEIMKPRYSDETMATLKEMARNAKKD